ncbi:serine/threonine protein kinase [Scytonema sp. NUACC26]|uniref:serine/threonine protein kinase n=1 Tax=Scytonema sp. NUACC26 TaxID=3140176 RepID=UPI0034DB976E
MNTPSTPNSWIGRSIGDRQRYRLDKRLGGGGMGDVFLAMDTRVGHQVALKLLKDTLVASQEMRKRFEREVAVCAALQNDRIVKVSDYGVTPEGYPFYVMEYLRGETLRQLLQREKRLSVERTAYIITQVCKGLQLAHEGVTLWRDGATVSEHIKVIHRDLKPDNIFLIPTELGEWVKILDFGIAKICNESAEQTNLTSAFIGTLRYASPEQLRGEKDIDGRADIYSLGTILYEMLSHTDPFGLGIKTRNISEVSWLKAHTSKPPIPLRSQPGCECLSPKLEAVVMQCLEKEPGKRFASMDLLNQALQSAVSSISRRTLEETIAQIPLQPAGNNSETIPRPLQAPRESKREETIAQIPLQAEGSDSETIPRPLQAPRESKREETIAQIPLANSKREETIAQPQPRIKSAEAKTIAPISNDSREYKREETIAQPRQKTLRFPRISINLLLILGLGLGLSVIGGIYAYSQLPSRGLLDEIQTLKTNANYKECINQSKKVSQDSNLYKEVQELQNECEMEYAKTLTKQSKCEEAIAVAKKIPEGSSFYAKTQTLIHENCEI